MSNQNPQRSTLQTSVYSEFEFNSANKIFNKWIEKLNHQQVVSPRFNPHPYQKYFNQDLNAKRSSIDHFTLGQIDELSFATKNQAQRLQTFPNNAESRRSLERLFQNKQNFSINSNVNFSANRETNRSKSYINAMKALQQKSKQIQQQKKLLKQSIQKIQISFNSKQKTYQQKINSLNLQIQNKKFIEQQLKKRIVILQNSTKQVENLIIQNEKLKQSKIKKQKKLKNSEKYNSQISEKYSNVVKQYQKKCLQCKQIQSRNQKLEKEKENIVNQVKKLKQKNSKLQNFEQQSKNKLIDRYNNILTLNQNLNKQLQKTKQNLQSKKKQQKNELKKIQETYLTEIKNHQSTINMLTKENQILKEKVTQIQLNCNYVKDQLQKKDQQFIQLLKNNFNTYQTNKVNQISNQHEKSTSARYKYSRKTKEDEQQQLNIDKLQQELNIHQQLPRFDARIQEEYKSLGRQQKKTGRFESKGNQMGYKVRQSRVTKKSSNTKRQKQTSSKIQKSQLKKRQKKQYAKPFSKSTYQKPSENDRSKFIQVDDSNLITFQNPFQKSRNKNIHPLIENSYFQVSQPRQIIQPSYDNTQVKQFNDNIDHICHLKPNTHFCTDRKDFTSHRDQTFNTKKQSNNLEDINKIMLIQAQKEALQLYSYQQQLLNNSKESQTAQERAEYIGRLKQLNEQIKINSDKICSLKERQNLNNN